MKRLRWRHARPRAEEKAWERVLLKLGSRLQAVLENNFVSLAVLDQGDVEGSGGVTSFVAVTVRHLSDYERLLVLRVHRQLLEEEPAAGHLDGDYLNLDQIRTRTFGGPVLICDRGEARVVPGYRLGLLDMLDLIRKGRVVVGRPVEMELPETGEDDMELLAMDTVMAYTAPSNSLHEALSRCLDICQALYVFENHTIVSRPEAASWFLEKHSGEWAEFVGNARRHGLDRSECLEMDAAHAMELQASFAKYVLELMERAGPSPEGGV